MVISSDLDPLLGERLDGRRLAPCHRCLRRLRKPPRFLARLAPLSLLPRRHLASCGASRSLHLSHWQPRDEFRGARVQAAAVTCDLSFAMAARSLALQAKQQSRFPHPCAQYQAPVALPQRQRQSEQQPTWGTTRYARATTARVASASQTVVGGAACGHALDAADGSPPTAPLGAASACFGHTQVMPQHPQQALHLQQMRPLSLRVTAPPRQQADAAAAPAHRLGDAVDLDRQSCPCVLGPGYSLRRRVVTAPLEGPTGCVIAYADER